MEKKRIVVTGMGVISPIGCDVETFWKSLIEGKSGVGPVTTFDTTGFTATIAGEASDYNALDHFDTKKARNLAKFVQYATVASREAVKNAGLDMTKVDRTRVGVLVGSGIGAIESAEEEYQKYLDKGARRISPHFIPK
ncbi:MAG: 3-oxoacyl-[acyl-carrier-protein] synthase II, partial [Candidatus Omnitrophota bacterium]